MQMVKLAIFGLVSVGIVAFSWRSLSDRRSHGFYRFFAFEMILALVLVNAEAWFRDPLSPRQIFSWLVLLASLRLAAHGFYLLRVVGQPEGDFENTTQLVTVGAYRYIRHPLYGSLFLFVWGAFLKAPSCLGLLLGLGTSLALVLAAKMEEAENLARFGEIYAAYVKTTKRFIPFLL
jgi:protein-S-isoprenylcysteine O-methyltransferase Ste14